jgi:hypothetical protein
MRLGLFRRCVSDVPAGLGIGFVRGMSAPGASSEI